jgi:hypothetical protein
MIGKSTMTKALAADAMAAANRATHARDRASAAVLYEAAAGLYALAKSEAEERKESDHEVSICDALAKLAANNKRSVERGAL